MGQNVSEVMKHETHSITQFVRLESTLSNTRMVSASTLAASLPCPSTTMELHVTLVFKEVNVTVDDIYVTIE
jgi:hypothetical protein